MSEDGIKIYDMNGDAQDWAWLAAHYGPVAVSSLDGAGWRLAEMREIEGPSALVVTLRDAGGIPLTGIRVAWYWPDAPEDPDAGPQNGLPDGIIAGRAVSGLTGSSGAVGFGMGGGAYYWPDQGQMGPHAAWVYGSETRSQVVTGLGMIGGTQHRHLDLAFVQSEGEEPPPEPPEPPEPPDELWAELLGRLDRIVQLLETILATLRTRKYNIEEGQNE